MNQPFSPQVLDHFAQPRNLGRLPEADGRGISGDLRDNVQIEITMRIAWHDDVATIRAVRFRAFGCGATIAAASMATTLIEGQPVAEAAAITAETIERALGGLPPEYDHSARLVMEAVQKAIADWQTRHAGTDSERAVRSGR